MGLQNLIAGGIVSTKRGILPVVSESQRVRSAQSQVVETSYKRSYLVKGPQTT